MVTGQRFISALVCAAALMGETFGEKKCSAASWGKKNDNVVVHPPKVINAGLHNTSIDVSHHSNECNLVGMDAIACDWHEHPSLAINNGKNVTVHRNTVKGPATVVVMTHCDPKTPHEGMPHTTSPHIPLHNLGANNKLPVVKHH